MKKKLAFILSPVVLAIVTLIWLFYKDNRWYTYRQEWQFEPLLVLHLLFPLFYLVMLIVMIVKHANPKTRADSDVFYIIASIVMNVLCFFGFLFFLIFTSGA